MFFNQNTVSTYLSNNQLTGLINVITTLSSSSFDRLSAIHPYFALARQVINSDPTLKKELIYFCLLATVTQDSKYIYNYNQYRGEIEGFCFEACFLFSINMHKYYDVLAKSITQEIYNLLQFNPEEKFNKLANRDLSIVLGNTQTGMQTSPSSINIITSNYTTPNNTPTHNVVHNTPITPNSTSSVGTPIDSTNTNLSTKYKNTHNTTRNSTKVTLSHPLDLLKIDMDEYPLSELHGYHRFPIILNGMEWTIKPQNDVYILDVDIKKKISYPIDNLKNTYHILKHTDNEYPTSLSIKDSLEALIRHLRHIKKDNQPLLHGIVAKPYNTNKPNLESTLSNSNTSLDSLYNSIRKNIEQNTDRNTLRYYRIVNNHISNILKDVIRVGMGLNIDFKGFIEDYKNIKSRIQKKGPLYTEKYLKWEKQKGDKLIYHIEDTKKDRSYINEFYSILFLDIYNSDIGFIKDMELYPYGYKISSVITEELYLLVDHAFSISDTKYNKYYNNLIIVTEDDICYKILKDVRKPEEYVITHM